MRTNRSGRASSPTAAWRQRAFDVAVGIGVLLVFLPAMVLHGLLVELPREVWRTARWSRSQRLADGLPGSASQAERAAQVATLVRQADGLTAERVAALGSDLPLIDATEIQAIEGRAPSRLRDELRAIRGGADMAVTRRAEQVAPQLVASDLMLWGMPWINDEAWACAVRALESAACAAHLGRVLDDGANARWNAAWAALIRG